MPSSAVRTFSDPDDYAASIRGGTVEFRVAGRGDFNAKLTRVELHHLWLQRFSENLPRVLEVANIKERAYISFRAQPGPDLLQAGVEIEPFAFVWGRPNPRILSALVRIRQRWLDVAASPGYCVTRPGIGRGRPDHAA